MKNTEKSGNVSSWLRRALLLLLALMMAVGCFAGCALADEDGDASEEEETVWLDNLPADLDFTGQTLRFLATNNAESSLCAEEINSDFVNDAVYWRNRAVEKRFGIKIDVRFAESDDMYALSDMVRTAVLSGTDDFDVCAVYQYSGVRLAQEGLLINLRNQEYLDFSQPWWSSEMIDGMAYKNAAYWCTGDLALPYINGMYCVFVNKKLWNDYYGDIDYYQMVANGEWTIDKMHELCKPVYQDLNRNNERDLEDQFGLVVQGFSEQPDAFIYGADCTFSVRDSLGVPSMIKDYERVYETMKKVVDLFHENEGVGHFSDIWFGEMAEHFAYGNALFYVAYVGCADSDEMRNMTDDFAVLPMPKLNEEQESYSTVLHDGTVLFGIPTTNSKLEMTTAALEALAAESYRSVTPIYYEQALKIKYVRDDQSAQMIDMLRDNIATDFAYYYHIGSEVKGSTSIAYHMRGIAFRGGGGIMSQIKMLQGRWKADLENLLTEMERYAHY